MNPSQAIEDPNTLADIADLMERNFTVEGATYWLLDRNPHFDGKSAAWLLMNDQEDKVLAILRDMEPQP